jgi:hypothetical protein
MKTKITFTNALKAGFFAGLAAAAVNAVLFFIFHTAGIITDDIFVQPETPMTVVPIIFSSLVPSVIAGLIYFLFDKYSSKGYRNFSILAIILFVLSLANPFMGIPNVTVAYGIALNVMHVAVFGFVMYFVRKANKA